MTPAIQMPETNYASGDEYMVEFLGWRFGFNAVDFEQRVSAAAVKLGLVEARDLETEEAADLVELASEARIAEPRSALGEYLVRHWEQLSIVNGESLVYWLRKLIFRSAWLDHRLKENLLEVPSTTARATSTTATRTAAAPCSSSRPCRPGTSCSTGRSEL